MTDNEIMKALGCCSTNNQKCYDCPLHLVCMVGVPSKNISIAALELIQRQQDEIKRLKERVEKFKTYAKEAWEELEGEEDDR